MCIVQRKPGKGVRLADCKCIWIGLEQTGGGGSAAESQAGSVHSCSCRDLSWLQCVSSLQCRWKKGAGKSLGAGFSDANICGLKNLRYMGLCQLRASPVQNLPMYLHSGSLWMGTTPTA